MKSNSHVKRVFSLLIIAVIIAFAVRQLVTPDTWGEIGYYRAEGSIWGNNAAYIRMNSPIEVLPADKQAWHLQIYIGAASKYQPYYTYAKQFVQELSQLHVRYQFDVENGAHSWQIWQIEMYHTLLWLHWGS